MHGYLKKEARTLRPNQLLPRWHNVQLTNREIRQAVIEKTQELSADPTKFFEQVVGFKPFAYQAEFIKMFQENQFTAARWCRQSGKTFIIAASFYGTPQLTPTAQLASWVLLGAKPKESSHA